MRRSDNLSFAFERGCGPADRESQAAIHQYTCAKRHNRRNRLAGPPTILTRMAETDKRAQSLAEAAVRESDGFDDRASVAIQRY